MEIKLSIVIPHYNIPQRLSVLLDSIPDLKEIKVIVVDDNSTKFIDEYENVVKKYSGRNITFLKNYTGKNSAGTCRNIGVEQAEGKWIMFADADDYFLGDWYKIVSQYFESDNDLVYFLTDSIQLDTGKRDTRHIVYENLVKSYAENPTEENELKLKYIFLTPWSKLFNRRVITEHNIKFESTIVSNDVMFTMYFAFYAKKFDCCLKHIYCLTMHRGSLTTVRNNYTADIVMKRRIKKAVFLHKNLSKEQMRLLGRNNVGFGIVYDALSMKLGVKKAFEYRKLLKQGNIRIITWDVINPFKFSGRVKNTIETKKDAKQKKKMKERYFVK